MNKVKTIRIQQRNGTYSQEIPIAADASNVTMLDGSNVQDKIAVLQAQIDTLQTLDQGSTTGDAQLIDVRLKADGQRSTTAGNAVRQQYNALKNYIDTEIDDMDDKCQQILGVAQTADATAAQALGTANNAENHMASLDSQIREIQSALEDVSIDVDDLGLEQDPDTYYVYPTYKGVRSENGIPLASSGGGGGGGTGPDVISAVLTVENTSGWLSKTIPSGSSCPVSFVWSSVEDGMSTGDGAIRITVNEIVRATMQISQGNVSVDLAPYLTTGTNKVKVRISDTYDQGKTVTFNITSIALSLSSSFDSSKVYNSAITFPYTPTGAVEKTISFYLDGQLLGTQVTSVSGRQMSYMIPAQEHGSHNIRVYFTAIINGEEVQSNELYYEFIYVEPLNNNVIVASSFSETTKPQYSLVSIPFQVYDPRNLTAEVSILVNDQVVSTQTVDRSQQSYTYRANNAGPTTIKIRSGSVTKAVSFDVIKSDISVKAETKALSLYLTSTGRSNNEEHPQNWSYDNIEATLNNFNFANDGWQTDADGATCLRVAGAARVTIPYKLFAEDFRSTGKTIELEFATRNVLNYDAVILSCMNGGRGLSLTSQKATLVSEQTEISAQYKENEHVRISFVVEKRSDNRLLLIYINGIPSGVRQYPVDDDFSQATPVDIIIGSNECTIDIYNIRVYDNNLIDNQILDNWIADTADGALMLERYTHNAVYDASYKIIPANLPADLPYFILNAPSLPQYKGDKKTISGSYVNKMFPSKSFTFIGCQINVQGTSSAVYARKNYDMQFKKGFELNSGHADNYLLREGNVPFNRFVLKADVASSEGANNVQLVRLYNDACPYKTPEMKEDSRVRWGIDGFPIVVFWNNTDTQEITFLGKYNFNLPKRAPGPYGYANDDTLESWEFQNNTSNLMLFKTDYFNQAMYTDPETGETKETWRFDYEARFPSDEYVDYTILQEFQSFVYSTYRENATGNTLPSPVTYEGVEYTIDSAAYRLAKFKAEFPTYAELDTFLFYYIFTELFLMVDSRAKNLFIGFNGSPVTVAGRHAVRKATAQPYDMDTAIGTNNEGTLAFGYSLEDTDYLPGHHKIFNGQESVLWCNIRDAFEKEIRQMYQTLRSNGIISYANIEKRFEDHQIKWPEAIWIEDSRFKYIDPYLNPEEGKEPNASYLTMMQGSKAEQRKWWLFNRFKYIDSKWNAGDSLAQVIILRGYQKANITVTPYTDIYPTIKYASYVVQERGTHGQPTVLICPLDTVSDTEISIYSAPQLSSVGDLAPLKVGFADFSRGTNLQEIKIGDASSSYDNPNLYALTLGSNVLLKKLDVRNCSGLGDTTMTGHTQTSVDLSNCAIIEEIYFDGTKVQGVTLPNGGNIKKLHLPNTITNLTILNQKHIDELVVAGYSNISTLRIENSSVDTKTILKLIPANSRVRLINVAWEAENATQIEGLLDTLDTMRGLDEGGNNMGTAQISGTIHTSALTGAQISSYNERYPYLKITADYVESYLTFKSYDGETTIKTVQCLNGEPQEAAPAIPARPDSSDGHYSYTSLGWNIEYDSQTADADALVNVIANRTVYPAYQWNVKTYTVTWVNNGTTIETDNNVVWGSLPQYNGSTPTKDGQTFTGWDRDLTQPITGNTTINAIYLPVYTVTFKNDTGSTTLDTQNVVQGQDAIYGGATPTSSEDASLAWLGWATSANSHTANAVLTNIQSSMTVYAAFEAGIEDVEITDTWDQIIANIDNGTYKTKYKIGNYKPIDLGETYGTAINMQIVAMDADELAGGGTAPLTFLAKELLLQTSKMNTTNTNANGYPATNVMKPLLDNTIYPLLSNNIKKRIQRVNKTYYDYTTKSTLTSVEKLWIPSAREMSGETSYESSGVMYTAVFKDATARIKTQNGSVKIYWLRSALSSSASLFRRVGYNGSVSSDDAGSARGVCLGFCLGTEAETIEDSWATILANENPSATYSIGDIKSITINNEPHLMQIVGFGVDDKTSGGKAKISWLMKDLLTTTHRMNATDSNADGWPATEMRTWLRDTILPTIDSSIRSHIVDVNKTYYDYTDKTTETSSDNIWLASAREIFGGTSYESSGPDYTTLFIDQTSRIKKCSGEAKVYWLRSASSSLAGGFRSVGSDGSVGSNNAGSAHGVCVGFCTD